MAEGFGLTIIEFREILQCSLKEYLGFTEARLAEVADVVFRTFDDDKVGRAVLTSFRSTKYGTASIFLSVFAFLPRAHYRTFLQNQRRQRYK